MLAINLRKSLAAGVVILLAAAFSVAPCRADEPDLNALVATVPLLSHESKALKSFSLRGRVQLREAMFVNFDLAWAAPDQCVMLISLGEKESTPVLYCAQNRMLLVDYFKGVVFYHEKGSPQFKVTVDDDDDKISFNMGMSTSTAGKIVVDLMKVLQGLSDEGKWEQLPDKTWRYSNLSKSGTSRVIGDFDSTHAYPLRKLEIRKVDDDTPFLIFENMAINEPLPKRFRSFPGRNQFPDGIVVETKVFNDDQEVAAFAEMMKQFMTVLLATAAIDNRDLREPVEHFGKVDWEQSEKNRRKYAPQLLRMLESSDAGKVDD